MSLMGALKDLGVDVDQGLDRVMGDASLYEMMLGMFLDSVKEAAVDPAEFDGGDLDGIIKRIHMLKGVTGNLSITPLFEGYNKTLVLLREGKAAQAKEEFQRIVPIQAAVVDCIEQNKGS